MNLYVSRYSIVCVCVCESVCVGPGPRVWRRVQACLLSGLSKHFLLYLHTEQPAGCLLQILEGKNRGYNTFSSHTVLWIWWRELTHELHTQQSIFFCICSTRKNWLELHRVVTLVQQIKTANTKFFSCHQMKKRMLSVLWWNLNWNFWITFIFTIHILQFNTSLGTLTLDFLCYKCCLNIQCPLILIWF